MSPAAPKLKTKITMIELQRSNVKNKGEDNMSPTNATRSQKAALTRKRNKYEAERDEAIQSARRDYLYKQLTEEQQNQIDDQLDSSTTCWEDELEEFVREKEAEVMDDIRGLLRIGVHPAVILNALEVGNCNAILDTGRGGYQINKVELLEEVLHEDEFQKSDSYVDHEEVDGIDYTNYDIPALFEQTADAAGIVAEQDEGQL